MTPDKPKELYFSDVVRKGTIVRSLENFDCQVKKYYLALDNQNIQVFDQLIQLYSELMLATVEDLPGFVSKFDKGSQVQYVLSTSASGAFRSLRVAHKLLLDGYFVEMHAALRMVEQWIECAVIVEGNPQAASRILEKGISNDDLRKALNYSKELKHLYKGMQKTFKELSQRAHPTKIAFGLIRKKEAKGQVFISGVVSEEIFHKDALALDNMVKNAINIYSRHFRKVPSSWQDKFRDANNALSIDTATFDKTE